MKTKNIAIAAAVAVVLFYLYQNRQRQGGDLVLDTSSYAEKGMFN